MDVTGRLMGWFASGHVGANIVVPEWWEADVLRVTDANRWDEVEIKLTVGDFRADAKKEKRLYPPAGSGRSEMCNKHALCAAGDSRAPNRFWFAVPSDLADKLTFPEWAGVLTFDRVGGRLGVMINEARAAPLLHKEANGGRVRSQLFTSIYYRYAQSRCFGPLSLIDGAGI